MTSIGFGPQVCGDLAAGGAREWLVPDGWGGYAMGTVSGLRTRRYHGLLVVAGATPATRSLGLAALDPVLRWPSGAEIRLGTHEWADGTVYPAGYAYLERFDLVAGRPRWRWRAGEVVLECAVDPLDGLPGVAVAYRLLAGGPVTLALDAVCTWRDAHAERGAGGPVPGVDPAADGFTVEDAFRVRADGEWRPAGEWWRGVHYREEAARGLPSSEDLWYAGRSVQALDGPGAGTVVLAWAGSLQAPPDGAVAPPARDGLAGAADAFVVRRRVDGRPDVVAGYPWFGAWSRDTMISYEGLFLANGRADEGRELLRSHAGTLSEGMLANTADTGQVEYNTADGTLWFVHAVERHVAVTGDTDLAAELLPALRGVLDAHVAGTRYGIRVDPADGLLAQGADGVALTWMDARVDGVPVTPRAGKAVEINALWASALGAVAELARLVGADPGSLPAMRTRAVEAFRRAFPAPGGGLYDLLGDQSFRPNQVFAYSLPYAPMEPDAGLLRPVAAKLLTPLGLRTLALEDPAYRGAHRGDPAARDHAYHQGTVWPWLIGPYTDACRRAGLPVDGLLDGLLAHVPEWGLGSVSETADGDPPHAATGCPFQAWSVAELLRTCRQSGQPPSPS